MNEIGTPAAYNLTTAYKPAALYFEDADSLEYVREDIPSIYQRVDETLTLIFSMAERERIIGFQIKGFKNFYLSDCAQPRLGDFLSLVGLLERVITTAGDIVFDEHRKAAYEQARKIALEDSVELRDFPKVMVG